MMQLAGILVVLAIDTTPMTKIVTLLTDLENDLEEQGVKEGVIYNEFNTWCDAERQESKTVINGADSKLADLTAFLEEQEAFRTKMHSEVGELASEVATNEEKLNASRAVRNEEHQQYLKNEETFVTTLNQVNHALDVLSADNPGTKHSISEIQQAVRRVLESSSLALIGMSRTEQGTLDAFFRPHRIPSFLQVTDPAEPLMQLLEQLRTDTENHRNHDTKEEDTARDAGQRMEQALMSELETGNMALSNKKKEIASSTERSAVKESARSETRHIREEKSKYLTLVMSQCQQKTREWKERTTLRSDELTAIGEARRILTSEAAKRIQANNPTAFLQTKITPRFQLVDSNPHGLALLEASTALGYQVKDPFSNVRKVIEGMVTRLLNTAADEADHQSWCDEEMKKTNAQKKAKEKDILKLTNRIDEMSSMLSQLSDELTQLGKDLEEMNHMTAEASDIRTREHSQSLVSIKEYTEAQSLLRNALDALRAFYSKKQSLLQSSDKINGSLYNEAKSDKASGVIGLLEIALSDFQRLQQEAETAESLAEKEFKDLSSDSKVQKVVFNKSIEFKSTQKVKLEAAIHRAKTDKQGYQRELAAVDEYFKKLEPSCTVKTDSLRTTRRKTQIKSLQEALKILDEEVT